MSLVEDAYRAAVDRMTPAQRMRRAAELCAWARRIMALQIQQEKGEMSPERLKWEIALRAYGSSSQLRPLIEQELARVST